MRAGHSPPDEQYVESKSCSGNSETVAAAAAAAVVSDDEGSITYNTTTAQLVVVVPPRTPLEFEFRGYSVWLELEQVHHHDLDRALDVAAHDLHVQRVPCPHVTVEYGIQLLRDDNTGSLESELELRRRFREYCGMDAGDKNGSHSNNYNVLTAWPALSVRGVQTGSTYDGVDGEDMTMAWIELTLATSSAHEVQVQAVRQALWGNQYQHRTHPKWTPHLSLCYENPQRAQSNLHYSLNLLQRVPTLTSLAQRRVTGMALWKTQGKMEDWQCLERVALEDYHGGGQQQEDPMMVGA